MMVSTFWYLLTALLLLWALAGCERLLEPNLSEFPACEYNCTYTGGARQYGGGKE